MGPTGINFFIHDLNAWGGQERSTLEILQRLSKTIPIHLYAYSYENSENANIHFHRCPFPFRRPVLLKIILFQLWTLWIKFTHPRRISLATGTCSLFVDIVHVQFITKAWSKRQRLQDKQGLVKIYHYALALYNECLEQLLYTNKKHFVAISKAVAKDLQSIFNLKNIETIPHGVDPSYFYPAESALDKQNLRHSLALPLHKKILLFVGAYGRKGLAPLIEGFKLALQKDASLADTYSLVAIGQGNHDQYRRLAGVAPDSTWLTLLPPTKDIQKLYQATDIFILPTLYEPFGLVILEAMSTGLPTITSKLAGAAELILPGTNGLLLNEPHNPKEICEAILKTKDSEAMKAWGLEARKTAVAHSWDNVSTSFASLIYKVYSTCK